MRYILIISILLNLLNAKIIEVDQLFNKKITKVKKESFSHTKSFYANSKIIDKNIVDVVTRFDGFIINLNANTLYMNIKKNQTLFSLYSKELDKIHTELQLAKNINKNLYESSLNKLKVLDISSNQISKLKKEKEFKKIDVYSSKSGILLQKNINDKSYVKKGKLLLQIANIDKLWVIAKVYQENLKDIKIGQKVKIIFDGIKNPIYSKVDFIYPNVDEKSKTVDIRITINNKEKKIFPNMFAKVEIQTDFESILTLPKTAVLNKASKYYVFKPISKKEFEPVQVEVKRVSASKYQIVSGLSENDSVINNALFLLDSDAVTNALYDNDEDDDW